MWWIRWMHTSAVIRWPTLKRFRICAEGSNPQEAPERQTSTFGPCRSRVSENIQHPPPLACLGQQPAAQGWQEDPEHSEKTWNRGTERTERRERRYERGKADGEEHRAAGFPEEHLNMNRFGLIRRSLYRSSKTGTVPFLIGFSALNI